MVTPGDLRFAPEHRKTALLAMTGNEEGSSFGRGDLVAARISCAGLAGVPTPTDTTMRQHTTSPNNHWGVSFTGACYGPADSTVLVQVQEDGAQARIPLSPEQAEAMAAKLLRFAAQAREANLKAPETRKWALENVSQKK